MSPAAQATIHTTPDHRHPGRTAILIQGATRETVQRAVDQIMLDAASAPGEVRADARGPHRLEHGGYVAAVRLDRLTPARRHNDAPARALFGMLGSAAR